MKPFDLLNTPLTGTHLIEASAGTGKTYTIEGLFVRLLIEKNLTVDQILVVTFTKAATEELKDRIRHKIRQTKEAFDTGTSEDRYIQKLVDRSDRRKWDAQQLKDALFDFDRASIFTIHGFCQHILMEQAFETGCLFDVELIADKTGQIREVSEDFWRKQLYHLPEELVAFIVHKIKHPDYFQRFIEILIPPETKIIPDSCKPELTHLQPYRQCFKQVQKLWRDEKHIIANLLKDPALSGTSYGSIPSEDSHAENTPPTLSKRDLKVQSLVAAMDIFTDSPHIGFPLFADIEKFTAKFLENKTRKHQTTPYHRFFTACQDLFESAEALENEMESYLLYLKREFFQYADSALCTQKKKHHIQFFDDLLIQVQNALRSENGYSVAEKIRHQYRAALIDEFQDTDPIQYDIFTRLFSEGGSLLFLIGDPKQAIYSFRGADLFSYMNATHCITDQHNLVENWRSSPKLLSAINTLFSQVAEPFIFKDIRFIPGISGKTPEALPDTLTPPSAPFTIWFVDSKAQKPVNKSVATEQIAQAVADEIRRLISMPIYFPHSSPPSHPVKTGDIAILVRTNRQARLIKDTLSMKGIPSVLYNAGNIFDTREAIEIERLLLSISEPGNEHLFRLAMATDMFGGGAKDMDTTQKEPPWWTSRMANFRTYLQIWQQKGFMGMFRLLMAQEGIRQRLLGYSDGERRITNVLHLSEILHHASVEHSFGVGSLLKWLFEQRHGQTADREELQLRLESDEDTVKIVTIHKSKGLEYPIVFCPFGWEGLMLTEEEIFFHDPSENNRLVLDLAPGLNKTHLALYRKELLAENIRLLYVALTRAKQLCYLAWGHLHSAETSGLAYLLSGVSGDIEGDVVAHLENEMTGKTHDVLWEEIQNMAKKSEGSIQIKPLPVDNGPIITESIGHDPQLELLLGREFCGKINRTWKIISYSSLISSRYPEEEFPDHDDRFFHDPSNRYDFKETREQNLQVNFHHNANLLSFPGGAKSGKFFHHLFEHLDFTKTDSTDTELLVKTALKDYGFQDHWTASVMDMVKNVVSAPLCKHKPDLMLSKIQNKDRINEMEFYFPIQSVELRSLQQLFITYGNSPITEGFSDRLGDLTLLPTNGFMKGYIDLIFSFENRYYLLDWKSNELGSDIEDYGTDAITEAMKAEFYFLQYHLYTLAFHRYLNFKQPGYDYEKDFGGVLYLFIRGINPQNAPEYGVFYDCPNPELVHMLGDCLMPGYKD